MRVAMSSGVRVARRSVITRSGSARPAAMKRATAPVSSCQTWARAGKSGRAAATRRSCSGVSTTHAVAPESARIQRTWWPEEVG